MRRLGHSKALAAIVLLPLAVWPQQVVRESGMWTRTVTGTARSAPHLRVNSHGPVKLEGGASKELSYTVKLSVKVRSEAEARRILDRAVVRVVPQGEWVVLTTPGGAIMPSVVLKSGRLARAEISTSEGGVEVNGIDGTLSVDSGAGELACDRIRGDCKLVTGGGDIRVGQVDGWLHSTTGAGRIMVRTVRGEAVLETNGGDISANEVGGQVRAETGGGGVTIGVAGGQVSATTGGGQINIGKAGGIVTARNMAGPVQIGAAAGVRCESGTGGVRLSNIGGSMRVFTSMGSIVASLLGGKAADSVLATGNGDIIVVIPSSVGLTIRAENEMADTLRRIVSDFPAVQARRQGTLVVAEGSVNGGGPLLRISGTGGTIFIKRQ
jgi:DUF4097 and DUF4098 domain-containing protein YvlB